MKILSIAPETLSLISIRLVLIIGLFLYFPICFSQKKGKYVNVINQPQKVTFYQTITDKNKDNILLINKYIDTTKTITIKLGTYSLWTDIKSLRVGVVPVLMQSTSLFKLTVVKSQLILNCTVFGMDGNKIAKIENNKLLPDDGLEQYGSSHWLEVISKNDIPVLQLELDKNTNSINIYGLYFGDNSFCLLSRDSGNDFSVFAKPFLLMEEQKRNTIWLNALIRARNWLVPFHNLKQNLQKH